MSFNFNFTTIPSSYFSSTLLQHLFTHMFFCDQCSFYTYSHYNLFQHLFEKHELNPNGNADDSLNPKAFDLLYVTRCPDGTFALCMESSLSTSNNATNNDQRLIISSAVVNSQRQNVLSKKKTPPQGKLFDEQDEDIAVLSEQHDISHRPLIVSKKNDKQKQTFIIMKHQKHSSTEQSVLSHSLTLEYNIRREHTIRQMCHTQELLKRRKFLRQFYKTTFIDEVTNCLRTIVNNAADSEEIRLEFENSYQFKSSINGERFLLEIFLEKVNFQFDRIEVEALLCVDISQLF